MIRIQNSSLSDIWIHFRIQFLIHLAYKTLCNVVSEIPDTLIYMETEMSSQIPLFVVITSILECF